MTTFLFLAAFWTACHAFLRYTEPPDLWEQYEREKVATDPKYAALGRIPRWLKWIQLTVSFLGSPLILAVGTYLGLRLRLRRRRIRRSFQKMEDRLRQAEEFSRLADDGQAETIAAVRAQAAEMRRKFFEGKDL